MAQDPEERIQASRRILSICEFHQSKRVMLGISRLRRYSRKKNEALGTYVGVLHDENSHGADAFGEFAVNCGINPPPPPEPEKPAIPVGHWQLPPIDHGHRSGRIKIG